MQWVDNCHLHLLHWEDNYHFLLIEHTLRQQLNNMLDSSLKNTVCYLKLNYKLFKQKLRQMSLSSYLSCITCSSSKETWEITYLLSIRVPLSSNILLKAQPQLTSVVLSLFYIKRIDITSLYYYTYRTN